MRPVPIIKSRISARSPLEYPFAFCDSMCLAILASLTTTKDFGPKDNRNTGPYARNRRYRGTKTGSPTISRISPAYFSQPWKRENDHTTYIRAAYAAQHSGQLHRLKVPRASGMRERCLLLAFRAKFVSTIDPCRPTWPYLLSAFRNGSSIWQSYAIKFRVSEQCAVW